MIKNWNRAEEQGAEDPNAWYAPLSEPLDDLLPEDVSSAAFEKLASQETLMRAPLVAEKEASTPTAKVAAPEAEDTIRQGAAERDRMTALLRGLEMGTKQIIGGITQTAPSATFLTPTNYEEKARAAQKQKDLLQYERSKDARDFGMRVSETGAKQALAMTDRERQALIDAQKRVEESRKAAMDTEKFGYQKEHDTAMLEESKRAHAAQLAMAQAQLGAKTGAAEKEMELASSRAELPFLSGVLKPTGPALKESDVAKIRDKVAGFGSAISGMDRLEQGILEFSKNPSLQTKNNLSARLQTVAQNLTTAIGSGVMNESEYKRISTALGADIVTPEGFATIVSSFSGQNPEEAASLLLSKLRAARDEARNVALEQAKTYQYKFEPKSKRVFRNPKTGETVEF